MSSDVGVNSGDDPLRDGRDLVLEDVEEWRILRCVECELVRPHPVGGAACYGCLERGGGA